MAEQRWKQLTFGDPNVINQPSPDLKNITKNKKHLLMGNNSSFGNKAEGII